MAELMALLRAPNRTSSNSTPPPRYGPTVDPNPWVPPTHAPKGIEAPAVHASAGLLTSVPLPSATLSAAIPLPPLNPTTLVPPSMSIPVPTLVYAAPSPMDSLMGAALDWYMSLKAADIPTWADLSGKFIDQYKYCAETPPTLWELNTMEMAEDQGFEAYAVKWKARAAKHVPPIRAYYLHLLAHTSSFSNLIDIGKKLNIGVKLGKIEGPAEKREGESSKKAATGTPSVGNRRGRDASVNTVNSGRQVPQQYSINYTPVLLATQAYAPPPMHYQQQLPAQQVYYSTPPAPFPSPAPHHYAPAPPLIQQSRPSVLRTPQPKLREKIQAMIDDKQLTFNAVKPPNVQANPLPDHRSSSGPSINMISVCAIGEYETGQEQSAPFIIEYVPAETGVGYAGFDAMPTPFVIEVPAREPYQDSKIIKASEYKVVEQMGKSPAHISLLTLLLGSEPHREALLKVLTAAQVPKETAPGLIEETVGSIFSNNISFSDDELPPEGYAHSRALHIVCKCNNFVVGRVMIDNDSTLNETAVPYISIGDNQNLPFHSFDTISVIRYYGKVGPSRVDRMVGKILLRHNYIPGSGLGARGQGINRPIEIEEYKNKRGLGFRPSCHEIIEARRGKHIHHLAAHYRKINRGTPVPPLFHFFSGPQHIVRGTLDGPSLDSDDGLVDLPGIYAVTEETPSGNRQLTSVEPTEEINVGIEEEPRTLKIRTGLDPTQRARMIDFLKEYQEVFIWSYADMLSLDPSIVKHSLPLDTENFPPKRQHLRRQRVGLLLRIKEEVVK
ncbi:hypothetical protein CRG98_016077 [Punica granatum]|uniref:G-patch domain-containing protein n=1 Tax=Punica granatum TaxID=22663 RepID=A0A2I0K5H1_PUNGR|nr:hypothetical protein CRG98_016077 [Punica granatum]